MTLRTRLLLTSLAVALPLAAALYLIDERLRFADMRERLDQFAATELASGIAARCLETDGLRGRPPQPGPPPQDGRPQGAPPSDDAPPPPPPARDGGPPPPPPRSGPRPGGPGRGGQRPPPPPRPRPDQRPYDVYSYAPDFTGAGPYAPTLDMELRQALATQDSVTAPYSTDDGRGMQMALWMSRDGGRCSILLLQMRPRRGERRDQIAALLLVTLSAMAAAWLAAGPVISRMRRLAEAVHTSADTRYEQPVPVTGGDEVSSLAHAFNEAGARVRGHLIELQQREENLRQFVANTAHDVGLPLTVLQGHLSELNTAAAHASDGDVAARTHVRAAMNEAHYLGSLVRNLNAATRLDAVNTPIERHDVDLNALVERIVARHNVVARARDVELNHAVPEKRLIVSTEVTLLEQAVGNLVDNAIRHNRAGGHVAIVLDGNERHFTLTVTDDGPGVKTEDLARLTERWFRSDEARTRRPDGQGLGLAIAAESLKRLGYSLNFSRPSDGGLQAQITGAAG